MIVRYKKSSHILRSQDSPGFQVQSEFANTSVNFSLFGFCEMDQCTIINKIVCIIMACEQH